MEVAIQIENLLNSSFSLVNLLDLEELINYCLLKRIKEVVC